MILQELVAYYEELRRSGKIAGPGWASAKVSYALCLSDDGVLTGITPLMKTSPNGKLISQSFDIPAIRESRTGKDPSPNFLWDNSKFVLGIDKYKENPKLSAEKNAKAKEIGDNNAVERFVRFRKFHHDLLDGASCITAKAILAFLDHWTPSRWEDNPFVKEEYDNIAAGANMLFRVEGTYAHEDPEIRDIWQKYYDNIEGVRQQCLVTGKTDIIPKTHPLIMGVKGAQSSGAALVSFNKPAFCSYGHEQNLNAPIGQYAAFAYTSALNYLLKDYDNVQHVGNTTIVCWANNAEKSYQDILQCVVFGKENPGMSEDDIREIVKRLANGQPVLEKNLDPNCKFCILGLDPSAARLSVRFFYRDTFGRLMKNINEHHERMKITTPIFNKFNSISLWRMLKETGNPQSTKDPINTVMAGAVMNSLFSGGQYPSALLTNTMLRIHAGDIPSAISGDSYIKAAIIKAYYIKNKHKDCPEEVLTVALNESSTNPAYVLGRLFAVLEKAQKDAAGKELNSTIRDKYLNSASSNPGSVFPFLFRLNSAHLRKLSTGSCIWYKNQIQRLQDVFNDEYPKRLNLPQQGAFILGYYHQSAKFYEKKEDN